MWSTSPSARGSTHSAWKQNKPQSKAAKYNTNKRQINDQDNHNPEICPCLCLYFLTQQFLPSIELFWKPHIVAEPQPFIPVLTSSICDAAAAIQIVIKSQLSWKIIFNKSHPTEDCWITLWKTGGRNCSLRSIICLLCLRCNFWNTVCYYTQIQTQQRVCLVENAKFMPKKKTLSSSRWVNWCTNKVSLRYLS